MRCKHLAGLLALAIILGSVVTGAPLNAAAASTSSTSSQVTSSQITQMQSELLQMENKNKNLQQQIDDLNQQKANAQATADLYQQMMDNTQQQIVTCNLALAQLQNEIDAKKQDLSDSQSSLASMQQTFAARVYAIYTSGGTTASDLDILLGAQNFGDLLAKSQLLQSVSDHDTQLMNNMQSTINQISSDQADLTSQQQQQQQLQQVLVQKQQQASALQSKANATVTSISQQAAALDQDVQTTAEQNQQLADAISLAQQQLKQQQAAAALAAAQSKAAAQTSSAASSKSTSSASSTSGAATQMSVSETANSSGYVWPLPGFHTISSGFGYRQIFGGTEFHAGLDITGGGVYGAKIVACHDGTIVLANGTWDPSGYGNVVIEDLGNGLEAVYGHMSQILATAGEQVKAGQVIGLVGQSGDATGPHLHFEIDKMSGSTRTPIDPTPYVG